MIRWVVEKSGNQSYKLVTAHVNTPDSVCLQCTFSFQGNTSLSVCICATLRASTAGALVHYKKMGTNGL